MKTIYQAETCATGGYLCGHAHRSRAAASRCLPRVPKGGGAFSMARVVAINDAAESEDALRQRSDDEAYEASDEACRRLDY